MTTSSRQRWFVVAIMFAFMLLHQSDKLLIGSLTPNIMETFGITMTQMGAVSTGALLVGAFLYPVWGYLYDRYARAKLLALASFIWGCTTWLNAIAPTYPAFLVTRASTGIDDSSYPGIYSLISDYFGPRMRGRVIGLLQVAMPLGFLVGMLLALGLRDTIGWRGVFYITGTLGIVLAGVILVGVKEPARGGSEPELAGMEMSTTYRFSWPVARGLFRIRTLRLLFLQGFFGVFPWNVISFWFIAFLQTERGYDDASLYVTMAVAVIVLAIGYPVGGALGDALFKRTPRGRVIVSTVGVLVGAVLMWITLNVPTANQGLFLLMLALTALFIPFSSPNVVSTVSDVTVPEVRSTAISIQYLIESAGAALAPLMAGFIADRSSLGNAILLICISAWLVCGAIYAFLILIVPRDIHTLREQMQDRADRERALAGEALPVGGVGVVL
ncbi:MAG TPA: MFS transporter [Anaerolineae bacterium]|nr:MFS transporter [Anaerolineae bacterium]